jgi:hypothetical protein
VTRALTGVVRMRITSQARVHQASARGGHIMLQVLFARGVTGVSSSVRLAAFVSHYHKCYEAGLAYCIL